MKPGRKIITHYKSENRFSFLQLNDFQRVHHPENQCIWMPEMQRTVSETLILIGNQTTRLLSLLFVAAIPWWKESGGITIFKKRNNCEKTAKFSRQTFECLFLKKETFMERSEWLGKLPCQEPGLVLPERPRLSQVSGCPFRGSGWRRGAQGVSPARWASFLAKATLALYPGAQRLLRLARAAGEALPAASRSPGASPHPWFPRPALSLRHPQVLRHFSEAGR